MHQQLTHADAEESTADSPARGTRAAPGEVREERRHAGAAIEGVHGPTPRIPGDVTTPRSKVVYLVLSSMRSADVTALSETAGIPQIRLYPVLDGLVGRGHVDRDGSTFSISRRE